MGDEGGPRTGKGKQAKGLRREQEAADHNQDARRECTRRAAENINNLGYAGLESLSRLRVPKELQGGGGEA
jgi:hypothetical protein